MASEELHQQGYLATGTLRGSNYGPYENLNIGGTTLAALVSAGLTATLPPLIEFPFTQYTPPKSPKHARPDRVFVHRQKLELIPIAVAEHKAPAQLKGIERVIYTAEQGLYSAICLNAPIVIATDRAKEYYVDVEASKTHGKIVFFGEHRSLNPAVLEDLLAGGATMRNPGEMAERIWQHIWHATKDEPKECLLTFVELFVLKFLSDNLPTKYLPEALRFYELLLDPQVFEDQHGKSPIEYYIEAIRPQIKRIFQDNTICADPSVGEIFGLATVVSKTSIINGFSFLKSSATTPASYNQAFVEILRDFQRFGPLTNIDPEFKLQLYETFLKKSVRQAKLGQFFTPRNVVRSIIRMAQLETLAPGSVVLDPAAGVGGFVLEPMLLEGKLRNNVTFQAGKPKQTIQFIGVDVDANTHILAKANLLIHFAESVRDLAVTPDALNQLMAQTFVLMNTNETLGSLEYPPVEAVDVIMTNPPYVTQGSRIYKDTIDATPGTRNGIILKEYYDRIGLGLESLFLRYIVGALKPGGKAYVIVPQGLLTRTELATKEMVLNECNLLASIALPRNTFFNTPQKTSILVLEKRVTPVDERPDVFCAVVGSIGETLDYRRHPTPNDNTLAETADAFVAWKKDEPRAHKPFVKTVSADTFGASDRWDVLRFWTDDELVSLGLREPAIERQEFIEEVALQMAEILRELNAARAELEALSHFEGTDVFVGDETAFRVRRGKRVRRQDCDLNPGPIPVYSGSKDPFRPLGMISEEWLKNKEIPIETKPIITVNANGYVGAVFVRNEPCVIHDDVTIIELSRDDIHLDYLAYALESAIANGNFDYEAKLYNRVKALAVRIPQHTDGTFDYAMQEKYASAIKRFNTIRQQLTELGKWSDSARFSS